MPLSDKDTDYLRRVHDNRGSVDTFGMPSQRRQEVEAELGRLNNSKK